ncbi:hypothetical protein BV898_01387 [Hypsibius exemplaris]|uniref:G-protein coupled receptors family 1 profile domain-containing protein n=1 Tax=Hypsibius exemplaris TaxID=2072580 RepID=A0A1W0XBA6_HYPEX|nr:hypothetical protein BV898_01387 [Hypsibius exemplaris]
MNRSEIPLNFTDNLTLPNSSWMSRTNQSCKPTAKEWTATLTFGVVITWTQLLNLLIFALWRRKEPYISLHVALAVASLLCGLTFIISVPLRYLPLTPVNIILNKLFGYVFFSFTTSTAILANFAISLDRWLSVEFPVIYRTQVTHRKTLWVSTVGVFGTGLVLVGTGTALYWNDGIVIDTCSRQVTYRPQNITLGHEFWQVFNANIFMPFLFLSQLRIVMISATLKLQRHRNQRVITANGNVEATRALMRIVWSSMLASMAVVGITLISKVPFIIVYYLIRVIPGKVLMWLYPLVGFLTFIMHFTSPLVYLLFWPTYRGIVLGLFQRLRCRCLAYGAERDDSR